MSLDKIYVISLHTETKRQNLIKKWLKSDKIRWWIVKRDNVDPKRGCFNSHRNVILDAKKNGYKNILILEDDAFPLKEWNLIQNKINLFLEDPPKNWKMLMLGYFPVKTIKTSRKNVIGIKCAYSANAYIVNVSNVVVAKWDGKIQIDDLLFCEGKHEIGKYFSSKFNGVYGTKPMLITQKSENSTINEGHMSIQTSMEKFQNESMVDLTSHVNLHLFKSFIAIISCILFLLLLFGLLSIKYTILTNVVYSLTVIFVIIMLVFLIIFGCDYDQEMKV